MSYRISATPSAVFAACLALLCLAPSLAAPLSAQPLDRVLDQTASGQAAAAESQQGIDRLDDESRALLDEYRQLQQQIELLQADNRRLDARVGAQQQRIDSLNGQLAGVQGVRRDLPALMDAMTGVLGEFIAADLPFLAAEREARLQRLRELQDGLGAGAAAGDGERFVRLLEAYDIELEYGRTLETWRGTVDMAGDGERGSRTVDFFRLGRAGLYYLSLDRAQGGVWDPERGQWVAASPGVLGELGDALSIAEGRAAPQFLALPLPAPKDAGRL